MKKKREVKAYAIGDGDAFQVVASHSQEIAIYWLKEVAGYSKEEMNSFVVREFPLDKKVFIRDFGETTAKELIEEVIQDSNIPAKFPIVVFSKEAKKNYFENWYSHFEIEEPTD